LRVHTFLSALFFSILGSAFAFAGVNTTAPLNNAQVGTPTNFVASATSQYGAIASMTINVDSQNLYTVYTDHLNTNLTLGLGQHSVYMKAWDVHGHYFQQVLTITVVNGGGSGGTGGGGHPGQQVISDVQNLAGWQSCDTCAGPGGHGHPDVHWMKQGENNPSYDGKTAEFYLGHTTDGWHDYSNALFYNRLTPNTTANNFQLDFYVYVHDPSVIQGLEMDVFYSRGGKKNYFLTECDARGNYKNTWQVSDATHDTWVHTGLPCVLQPYSWNHVVLQFLRNPDGSTNFVSVSMNGNLQYVNRTYAAENVDSSEMNPAIQLDGDENQDPIDIWVDRMTLTSW
jgi:hypothetical protein